MAYCEQCGTKLSEGARFCSECGTAVTVESCSAKKSNDIDSQIDAMTVFSGADWASKWSRAAASCENGELGIILTRASVLYRQVPDLEDMLDGGMEMYIDAMKEHGVFYYYLDLDRCAFYDGDGDVDSVVATLRKIVDVARPKYLFILGNEDVIDVARWENQAGDSDDEVESDLCYATLDVNSPWNGQTYNFDDVIRVGRFPTCTGDFDYSLENYCGNMAQWSMRCSKLVPYGLSARVWKDESNAEYHSISSDGVVVSPEVTKESVGQGLPRDATLMFFNLHGSDETKYWYGQEGAHYPEAFSPEILFGWEDTYFIGVEACYGARYIGNIHPDESILLTALRNSCLAFLGSSRIAYGSSEPQGVCADIVVGEFIRCLPKGYSAGDAYIEGLKKLTCDSASMDDTDVKTLAEFALYGDPAACMDVEADDTKAVKSSRKGIATPKGLSVPMPDVRKAVSMAIAEVDAKIEAVVDSYFIRNILPQFTQDASLVQQSVYKMSNTGLNQKVYISKANGMTRVAKVYFDDRGTIKKAVVSK